MNPANYGDKASGFPNRANYGDKAITAASQEEIPLIMATRHSERSEEITILLIKFNMPAT
jgi:hypothetical protein